MESGESIRVPSQLHGGVLSPSKSSYMPALIEVGNERTRRLRSLHEMQGRRQAEQERSPTTEVKPITIAEMQERDAELARRMIRKCKYREKYVLQILFEHEKLAKLQADFDRNDGVLDLEKFLISVLVNFELFVGTEEEEIEHDSGEDAESVHGNQETESQPSRPQSRQVGAKGSGPPSEMRTPSAAGTTSMVQQAQATAKGTSSSATGRISVTGITGGGADEEKAGEEGGEVKEENEEDAAAREAEDALLFNIASIVELFREIDVHSVGEITWEECSSLLIEQGKSQSNEMDGAVAQLETKAYQESSVTDLSKHEANVERLVYLPEKNYLACFSQSRKFRIYDPKKLHLKAEVAGHRGSVITCIYVEPMDQIATCAADMTICLWDSNSLKLRSRVVCRDVQICLAYNSQVDPSCIYSGSIDGTVSKWDLTTLALKDSRKAHKAEVNDLLMLPDMLLIASASSDCTIYLWDVQSFKPKKHLKGHKKSVLQLAYSMGCLLSVGLDQEALVWNPYVDISHLFKLKGHTHSLVGIQIGVGSYPQIITGDIGGILRVWDVRNFGCSQVFGATDAITDLTSFCVIPELKRIACGIGNIRLYDYLDSREGENAAGSNEDEKVTDALEVRATSWDGHRGRFFTLSRKSIKIWDAESGRMIQLLKDLQFTSAATNLAAGTTAKSSSSSSGELTAFVVSNNNRKLIVGNSQGSIASFSMMGKLLREFSSPNAPGEEVTAMALYDSPLDGPLVLSGSGKGSVKIHADTGSALPNFKTEYQAHGDAVLGLAVGRETAASWSSDGTVCLCDLKSLKQEQVLTVFQDLVVGCDFVVKTNSLVCAEAGGNVSIFEKPDRESPWRRTYQFHQAEVLSAYVQQGDLTCLKLHHPAAAPDRVHLFLGDMKGQVREYDLTFYWNNILPNVANPSSSVGFMNKQSKNENKPFRLQEAILHEDSVQKIAVLEFVSEEEEGTLVQDAVVKTVGLDKRVKVSTCTDLGKSRGVLCNADSKWEMFYAAGTLKYAEAENMMLSLTKKLNQKWREVNLVHPPAALLAASDSTATQNKDHSPNASAFGHNQSTSSKKTQRLMEQLLRHSGKPTNSATLEQLSQLDLDDIESTDFNHVCDRLGAKGKQLSIENSMQVSSGPSSLAPAAKMRQRKHPLSEGERAAAEKLAKALERL
ncbi:unnamed protein product [Amoebophrya sp. A120]|nr:unnamed protein product [Amoebophrya sp. A120]|eukprot:GSA120T00017737001.1